jgi:hypothetical protein
MIPRSYSRDLTLQLNFIYDAARRLGEPFEGDLQTLTRRPLRPSGLFGFADSKDRYSMSFIFGIFAFLCRRLHSGNVFSGTSCITATLVFPSTSVG